MKLLLSSALVFAASFLSYWSSLDGGFVFDDHRGVLTNDDLDSSKSSLWEVFQHDFWGGFMSRKESHKSYRPLTVLTYRYLNFHFSGLDPYSYHLVNVLLHSVASVLVLALCRSVLGDGRKCSPAHPWQFMDWSTYAALLFAAHSIHTEAVASVVGRAEVLSCIFFLLSIISYCKGVSKGHGPSLSPLPRTKWFYVLTSLFLCLCAMLSKEQGIVSIGACATFDIILHWEVFWAGLVSFLNTKPGGVGKINGNADIPADQVLLKEKNSIGGGISEIVEERRGLNGIIGDGKQNRVAKKRFECSAVIASLAKRLGLLVVSGLTLMWFRLSMNYNSQPIFKVEELQATFHPNRSVRIMSFSNIYVRNAWLLLQPSSLCCDWTLGSIPLVTTLTDSRNIWSILLYLAIVVLLAHVVRSKKQVMPVGMGVALLLLSFLPASGLVFRVGFVIAERVLYMPSIGLCLLVATGARRISNTLQHKLLKMLLQCCMACLIIVMAAKTYTRNKDWATDFALFESGVRVNPLNVKLHNNYGIELKAAGRVKEALYQYQQSLAIDPNFAEVYMNLGNLLSDDKNYAEALIYFEKAIEYPQMYHKTLNNLATTYFRLGKYQKAEVRFLESIQASPDQAMTFNNIASLYGEMKRYKESEKMFRKALKLNPQYTEAYFNLGTLFVQMGELDKGEKYLLKALELHPHHPGALNNLKICYEAKAGGEKHLTL